MGARKYHYVAGSKKSLQAKIPVSSGNFCTQALISFCHSIIPVVPHQAPVSKAS